MTQPQKAPHPNLILGICCMSVLLLSVDVTIVNVALPAIEQDLHATLSQLQWMIDAYTLVVASLLMFSGSVADRIGRRRVFQTGLAVFTTGSVLCSLAPSAKGLIAFRALQGLGASMMNPVALSIIANAFPQPKDRANAVGIWSAVGGLSIAIGPMLGGALTQAFNWRYIFWINLPIGVATFLLCFLYVPESKAPRARAFDPLGQLLLFLALASFTFAIIEGPRAGWASTLIVVLFALAFVTLTAFLLYEPRIRQPLLDLRFFRSVPFASATLLAVCSFGSFAGFLFLNALYLQKERGLTAFHAGLATLPLALTMMATAPLAGRMVGGDGTSRPLYFAGAAFFLSTLALTRLTSQTPILLLLGVYALFGVGLGMVNPAISNNAVAGMPLSQSGVAAAVASTSRQVGAALGVAIAGSVVAIATKSTTHQKDLAGATHPIWWAMTGCGALIFFLGWFSNTEYARDSTSRIASLFHEPVR